jgi:MHS family alpha-ketoglutarate permease-like MFS transporter
LRLLRPAGGWVQGIYAGNAGRRAALTLSVTPMRAGSFLIAIVPTCAVRGLGAPILFLVAHLIQGVSLGGECGTSAKSPSPNIAAATVRSNTSP